MGKYYFKCIVCDKQLRVDDHNTDSDDNDPVMDGIHFQAHGNWGSTVWDLPDWPMKYLEVVICDHCIIEKRDLARIYLEDGTTKPFKSQNEWRNVCNQN